jgi:hypothetical protein
MKYIMVFMAFIAIIIPVKSQEISEELAVEVATIYMSNKSLPSMEVANVLIEECKGQNSFYVINFIKGGWIMVSSTKSATPILAYGLKGSYQLYDEKPPAFIKVRNRQWEANRICWWYACLGY